MARPLLLSNGHLHVGINNFGMVHDIYYPHVGGENHAAGESLRHKIGVWIDGKYSWLDDGTWQCEFRYHERSLVSEFTAKNSELQICIESTVAVLHDTNAFVRSFHIVNGSDSERDIRLFQHQVFTISDSDAAMTAQYLPDESAILHYKSDRYFMVGGRSSSQADESPRSFDEFAIGLHGIEGRDGTHRDAEDGHLSQNRVEHGMVDSVIGFYERIAAHDSANYHYWIVAGKDQEEVTKLHESINQENFSALITHTYNYWQNWSEPIYQHSKQIADSHQDSFIKSAMILKSQLDHMGGAIASTDTRMLNYSRDSYAYVWPRDTGFVLWPLLRMGYKSELKDFFAFSQRIMHKDGYMMHKYLPDGALGSSWHPYTTKDGITTPPIQEDETAIIVFLFARYYELHNDKDLLITYYHTMLKPMCQFMCRFIDEDSGLPLPSYDLWERLFESTTHTTALVYAALIDGVKLAEEFGQTDDAVQWQAVADRIYDARATYYSENEQCFIKGWHYADDGSKIFDETIDSSSAYGAFTFGLFELDSREMKTSVQTINAKLNTSQSHPGIARFVDDEYDRYDPARVGNPWPICTLWQAQYALELNDEPRAMELIDWVRDLMTPTGTLPEQLHPDTLEPISVMPLTWTQAEYINTLLDSIPNEGR